MENFYILKGGEVSEAIDELCFQRLKEYLKDDFIVDVMCEDVHPNDIQEVAEAMNLVVKFLRWTKAYNDVDKIDEWYEKGAETDKNKKISVSLDMYHMSVIITALQRMKKDLLYGCQMDGTDELSDAIDDTRKIVRKKQLELIDYFGDYPDVYNKILKDIDYIRKGIK